MAQVDPLETLIKLNDTPQFVNTEPTPLILSRGPPYLPAIWREPLLNEINLSAPEL